MPRNYTLGQFRGAKQRIAILLKTFQTKLNANSKKQHNYQSNLFISVY